MFGAFRDDFKLYTFGGSNLAACIDTAEAQPFEPAKSFIRAVRPLIQGNAETITTQIGKRDSLEDSVSWGDAVSLNSRSNRATFRSLGRYQRVRINLTGDNWERAIGVDVEAMKAAQW